MDLTETSYYRYATAHGVVTISATRDGIHQVHFGATEMQARFAPCELTNRAATQLQEYLAGKRQDFDVPLSLGGSAFQRAVWTEVAAIPYGETRTPAQIAEALGKPGSHRSVGTAIRLNKLAPFIPTHRIDSPSARGRQAKIFRGLRALEHRFSQDG